MLKWTKTIIGVGVGLVGVNLIFAYLNDRGSEKYPNPVFREK
jgi:hypothetical protein